MATQYINFYITLLSTLKLMHSQLWPPSKQPPLSNGIQTILRSRPLKSKRNRNLTRSPSPQRQIQELEVHF